MVFASNSIIVAKRFAKQQRSNVQVLACVYCYFLGAEQTALKKNEKILGLLYNSAAMHIYCVKMDLKGAAASTGNTYGVIGLPPAVTCKAFHDYYSTFQRFN